MTTPSGDARSANTAQGVHDYRSDAARPAERHTASWPREYTCSECGRAIPCRHHPDAPTLAQQDQEQA